MLLLFSANLNILQMTARSAKDETGSGGSLVSAVTQARVMLVWLNKQENITVKMLRYKERTKNEKDLQRLKNSCSGLFKKF